MNSFKVSLKNRREAYSPEKRKEWTGPVEGPWLHGSIIHLLEKGEADADNLEMDSFLLCLPHLVRNHSKYVVILSFIYLLLRPNGMGPHGMVIFIGKP